MKVLTPGSYNGRDIRLVITPSKRVNSNVFVNVHGLYGLSGDVGSKSTLLGETILRKGLANVVYYSSSRNWDLFDDTNQDKAQQAFEGKTFAQESEDLFLSLKLLLEKSKEFFGIDQANLRFYIVASSLGGTVVSNLHEIFESVDKIVLCGSGAGPSSSSKPILSSYPPKEQLFKSTQFYKGDVMLLQGSEDHVVPLKSGNDLLESYISANYRTKIVIEGANHNFSNIYGKNTNEAYMAYINAIIDFLKS